MEEAGREVEGGTGGEEGGKDGKEMMKAVCYYHKKQGMFHDEAGGFGAKMRGCQDVTVQA